MKIKSNEAIALRVIEEWKESRYQNYCQKRAKLQCLIIEQLELKDKNITATLSDYHATNQT